jgi:DNA-binding XRE family transcriptional regulator
MVRQCAGANRQTLAGVCGSGRKAVTAIERARSISGVRKIGLE